MPAAPLPLDEDDRLAALSRSGLLKGRASPRTRSLTRLATSLLQRPSAGFSLITADRQIFRPAENLPFATTSRDASFCAHAILLPDRPLVVEDALEDERFFDNPLVTGTAGLRFYAGMPVRAENGQPVGALCVCDTVPGSFSNGQADILRSLAAELESSIRWNRPTIGDRQVLVRELRQATAAGSLSLQWQPVAAAHTLNVRGYEALVRWNRPDGSAVGPDVFIPLAEASGLIERIDSFVMRAACVEATRWPEAHSISVNVSARWFQNKRPKLSKLVEQALSRSGLLPHRLVIELTERVLIVDPKVALEEMRTLQAMGVHVALDDFGTGYSSLGYIEAFPFGVVKLDKAFVRGLGNSRRAEAVGRAVIRLGHDLGMTIVAEGVENQHQLAFLRQEGCDFVQGYLIGRPGSSVLTSP